MEDVEGVLELISNGDLDPKLSFIIFDEIPEGLKQIERHEISGRLVADLTK